MLLTSSPRARALRGACGQSLGPEELSCESFGAGPSPLRPRPAPSCACAFSPERSAGQRKRAGRDPGARGAGCGAGRRRTALSGAAPPQTAGETAPRGRQPLRSRRGGRGRWDAPSDPRVSGGPWGRRRRAEAQRSRRGAVRLPRTPPERPPAGPGRWAAGRAPPTPPPQSARVRTPRTAASAERIRPAPTRKRPPPRPVPTLSGWSRRGPPKVLGCDRGGRDGAGLLRDKAPVRTRRRGRGAPPFRSFCCPARSPQWPSLLAAPHGVGPL